ncbi:MAG: LPP20 family lipoprotein [Nitrospira sp.]|nr:LPP20 family lipoprotein [Nitrospira sp.]
MLIALWWSGCAWLSAQARPSWIDDPHQAYPSAAYLTGVGQAENRQGAADQAYAAVARIFKANVDSHAKDWEAYFLVEKRGSTTEERRLALETVTKVSTDKVLENVRIMETWYDRVKGVYYALAVMDRAQAEMALLERLSALDQAIEADVSESRRVSDAVLKVRKLRRAAKNLVVRDVYNADLRIIRLSGQGVRSPYQADRILQELEDVLATDLTVAVQVFGDHAEVAQQALAEGLVREGITVIAGAEDRERNDTALIIRGVTKLMPVQVHDSFFKYVRWCGDVELWERATGRVMGIVSGSGKEGHLTEREAMARALRALRRHLSSEMAPAITAHLFGEAELPMPAGMSGGCPRDE